MSLKNLPYTVFPLGDAAITIDFGNTIDELINQHVSHLFYHLKGNPLPGMVDIVPAYSSLTIHYDIASTKRNSIDEVTAFETIKRLLDERMNLPLNYFETEQRIIKVPVCYEAEFAPDLQQFISVTNISSEELVEMHTNKVYRVFMIGFLPGFAYMGEVDEKIAMPRKKQPNIVAAGSVGIAGRQTGIYPLISPGGWHIIGRTPMKIFNPENKEPVLLRTGDTIQFYSISKIEYASY